MAACKIFDTVLTRHQRVLNRFGLHKKPDTHAVEVEKAKTLKGIHNTLIGNPVTSEGGHPVYA